MSTPIFSNPPTPVTSPTPTGRPAMPEFIDDDLQAAGDDHRDKAKYDDLDGWRPADGDLA